MRVAGYGWKNSGDFFHLQLDTHDRYCTRRLGPGCLRCAIFRFSAPHAFGKRKMQGPSGSVWARCRDPLAQCGQDAGTHWLSAGKMQGPTCSVWARCIDPLAQCGQDAGTHLLSVGKMQGPTGSVWARCRDLLGQCGQCASLLDKWKTFRGGISSFWVSGPAGGLFRGGSDWGVACSWLLLSGWPFHCDAPSELGIRQSDDCSGRRPKNRQKWQVLLTAVLLHSRDPPFWYSRGSRQGAERMSTALLGA